MEKFIIELKDYSKRHILLELLTQLDFIEIKVKKEEVKEIKEEEDFDFFKSAGLFADRNIDANHLRKQAWRINN